MPVRLSGMISGLDTDTLIKGILDAERLKNKKVSDKQTTLMWKEEKWKELNAKLYKLYADDLSKLRLQGNYGTKKVTTTNDSLVEVKGSNNAPTGSSQIKIEALATGQSIISAKLGKNADGLDENGKKITGSTLLKDIGFTANDDGKDVVIKLNNNGKESSLIVTGKTTLNDFINASKNAGLNASFDQGQGRIFISSKTSGEDKYFTINTGQIDSSVMESFEGIKEYISPSDISKVTTALNTLKAASSEDRGKIDLYWDDIIKGETVTGNNSGEKKTISALETIYNLANSKINSDYKKEATAYIKETISNTLIEDINLSEDEVSDIKAALAAKGINEGDEGYETHLEDAKLKARQYKVVEEDIRNNARLAGEKKNLEGEALEEYVNNQVDDKMSTMIDSDKDAYFKNIVNKEFTSKEIIEGEEISKAQKYEEQVNAYVDNQKEINKDEIQSKFSDIINKAGVYANGVIEDVSNDSLSFLGMAEIDQDGIGDTNNGMVYIKSKDAQIDYNGVKLTSDSNVFSVNGLTITVKGTGQANEVITLNTVNDNQAVYDSIKSFVKSYNEILKEMNTLYNADLLKGYAPLSDDEKEMMTDSQIEKWESKIKESILRRDDNLGSLIDAMRNALNMSVEIDGKKYSLASLGITTSSDYNERGILYIHGDDELGGAFSGNENKLMKMLESEPDKVSQMMSKITGSLYSEMDKKMKSIPNVRSAFTFYNDKTMKNQIDAYGKDIKSLEKKLIALEEKYYKQFAAMETALAKLQSQSNALASMLGLNNNQ